MNKKCKICLLSFLTIFLLVSLFTSTQAQVRGKALYEKLRQSRNLVKYEGERRISWLPDDSGYYIYKERKFKKVDITTGKTSPLFDEVKIIASYNALTGKNVSKLPFSRFTYLDEGEKIRFVVSSKAFIYNLDTGKIMSYVPERSITGVRGRQYGEQFSPDFKYRAYTRDYNLYIKDLDENETALTTNGHKDLRNGFPDWVYPEELSQYEAFWWSPDSKKIAYMQFDESPVRIYPIVHDVSPAPELEMQRYPKAGASNPIINFFIVDIKTKKTIRIETGMETNVYLFRGKWTNDGKEFTYQRLNRLQNVIELFAADPETGKVRRILKDEDKCYIEATFDMRFLKNNTQFLWTSERSGWKEIYLYDFSGKLVKQLTNAKLPVRSILSVDEENGWVYFSGSEKISPSSSFPSIDKNPK